MTKDAFRNFIEEIKHDKKPRTISAREFINCLGCERRTVGNVAYINRFLDEHELETVPNYNDVWIDSDIVVQHKKLAARKNVNDPVKRIKILKAANTPPVYVTNDSSLQQAITLMMIHDFSQLPVTQNGNRNIVGFISWQTIGTARQHGVSSNVVKDYKREDVRTVSPETPLLDVFGIVLKNDFVVVVNKDKALQGIITTTDISAQFLSSTEPFLLIEEIENHIRNLLNEKLLLERIQQVCQEEKRKVESIDDLTFGEYLQLFGAEDVWERLGIRADRSTMLKQLDHLREIRNDVMHFEPEGISHEQNEQLRRMVYYFRELSNYSQK